jgi:hypothetical protein
MRKKVLIAFGLLAVAVLAIEIDTAAAHCARKAARAPDSVPQQLREHVQMHRDFKYRQVEPNGAIYTPGVPPDYCDLPSAGCESYLAN